MSRNKNEDWVSAVIIDDDDSHKSDDKKYLK